MIAKCTKSDEKRILTYIGYAYPSCLYLYLDLLKYGIESSYIDVYIQTHSSNIDAVLLRYYSCLHVYSVENSFNAKELANFFALNHFTMLYCTAETAEHVYMAFSNEIRKNAIFTRGWVSQIQKIDHEPRGIAVAAEEQDFVQIIQLIYEDDDIGRSYKYCELSKQMQERNQEGYSRNLIIKQDSRVIAHACTNAEINGIAVVAELLVREGYRRKGFASEIWRTICSQLLSEGKEVYSIYYSEESRTLHKHIGFHEVCEWAKVVISRDSDYEQE